MRRTIGAACLTVAMAIAPAAVAQKHGGVLTLEHIDNPPSPSIQEEATASVVIPFMAMLQQPGHLRPARAAEQPGHHRAGTCHTLDVEPGDDRPDLHAARGRQVARRQAIHLSRCEMHMGHGLRPGEGKDPEEPAPGLVQQPGEDHCQRRPGGDVSSETAQPSFIALLATGWSPVYPCHVPSAQMRTKPIGTGPFRFVEFRQNEVIRLDPQSGLLEAGTAVSRRHRVHTSSPAVRRGCWHSSPASSTWPIRPTSRCRC